MSSSEHLIHLIWAARVRPDVAEAERKSADLELLALLDSSECVGDGLVCVATSTAVDASVRLNAALALPGLVRRRGLACFADKEAVILTLTNYLLHPLNDADAVELKIGTCAASALSLIAVKDSDARWSSFLDQCFDLTCRGNSGAALFLQALSEVAKDNTAVWGQLASSGATQFISALANCSQLLLKTRLSILQFFFNLLSHRPRSAACSSLSCAGSTLLSSDCRQFFAQLFCQIWTVGLSSVYDRSTTAPPPEGVWRESAAVSRVTGLLLNTAEMVRAVFAASLSALRTLHHFAQAHAPGECGAHLGEAAYALLECMTVCLQIFPQECVCGPEELLQLLLPFITDVANIELDVQSKILFMDDEVVPIGCLSDDVHSLALSIVELALDENKEVVPSFVRAVLAVDSGDAASKESVFLFKLFLLRSISRVLDFNDRAFVDVVDTDCLCAVYQVIADFAHHGAGVSAFTWMTCIDIFSLCFSSTGAAATELPFSFLKGVSQLWDTVAQISRSGEESGYLQASCLAVVGRHVESARVSAEDTEVLPAWLQKAVEVTAGAACTFAVYAGSLVLGILAKHNELKCVLAEQQGLLVNALANMCAEGVERTVAKNVSAFLANVLLLDDAAFAHPCAEYLTNLVLHTVASAPLRYSHLLRYLCEYGNKVMHARMAQPASDGSHPAFNLVVVKVAGPLTELLPAIDLDDGMLRAGSAFLARYTTICAVEKRFCECSPLPAALRCTVALLAQSGGTDGRSASTCDAVCASVAEQLLVCEDMSAIADAQEAISAYFRASRAAAHLQHHAVATLGTCLLHSILTACAPQSLYQTCDTVWWSAVQTSWCGLAPFMDPVTLRCTLTSWSVLLSHFLGQPHEVQQHQLCDPSLAVPCSLFPSPYIKKIPASKGSLHLVLRIVIALYDVRKRWLRSPKITLIPATFLEFTGGRPLLFFELDKSGLSRFPAHEISGCVDELVRFYEDKASQELKQTVQQHLDAL